MCANDLNVTVLSLFTLSLSPLFHSEQDLLIMCLILRLALIMTLVCHRYDCVCGFHRYGTL